jgi:solute carrier family 25 protein 39/40
LELTISYTSLAPLELVRTRQASATNGSARSQRTILDEFRLLLRTSGPAGLYRGLVPMVLRDVPFSAIYFATLEYCRTALSKSTILGTWGTRYYYIENNIGIETTTRPPVRVDMLEAFLAAVVAGSIATIVTTPLDVVKTRRMTVRLSNSSSSSIEKTANQKMINGRSSTSLFGHMRLIVKEEGIVHGLWRGNWARMIKVAPGMALMISSYELGKRLLEDVM